VWPRAFAYQVIERSNQIENLVADGFSPLLNNLRSTIVTEITGKDIAEYLDCRDDFDLELFALRSLRERGWSAHHGGTYVDPHLHKPRQYDVRALYQFGPQRDLLLAVECKSLSPEAPLVVSRVPRDEEDSFHELLKTGRSPELGTTVATSERSDASRVHFYPKGAMVGKSMTQIRRDGSGKLVASDSESYDKWSQALTSSACGPQQFSHVQASAREYS
jgi:hypothetical protein